MYICYMGYRDKWYYCDFNIARGDIIWLCNECEWIVPEFNKWDC